MMMIWIFRNLYDVVNSKVLIVKITIIVEFVHYGMTPEQSEILYIKLFWRRVRSEMYVHSKDSYFPQKNFYLKRSWG